MELIITPRRSGTFLRTIENLKRHNLSETTGIVTSQTTINQIKDKSGLILINHEDFIAGNYDKEKIQQIYVFEIRRLLNIISDPPVIRAFITASMIID